MSWPFVPRDRYDDLADRYQNAVAKNEELTEQLRAEHDALRTTASQYCDADTTATRLDDRVKRLQEHCRVLEEECLAAQHARELLATQHREETGRLKRELDLALRHRDTAAQLLAKRASDDEPVTRRRLNRALRACARYRIQVSSRDRIIRAQQRQLDDATGLNIPDVLAGANWQARRADKRGLAS